MLKGGVQEGLSLLTINLDKCVRCGNCVRACQARHGHARVTRRGKKLVRRADMEAQGRYETLLLPSSCRHCVNPECMVMCPTGAIHRLASGEVDIEPYCIGCGSCANRCPYDNITMVPTPGRTVDGKVWETVANKCNLCAGYGESNCVHNCPTGAILRVEPTSYFEELAAALGKTGQAAVGHTDIKPPRELTKVLAPALFGLLSVALLLLSFAGGPYSPWSMRGLALGATAFAAMLGATALAARKRLMGRRNQLGIYRAWTRVHVWLGGLALVAVVAHSHGRGGGLLTSILLTLTVLEVLTGLFGVVLYKWIPRAISRIEGDSQVEEDVREELEVLDRRVAEFRRAGEGDRGLVLERIATDVARRVELLACLRIYTLRKSWLAMHIGVTAALLTLAVVHVLAVLFYATGAAG